MRFAIAFCAAVLISLGLFWLMQWLVTPPEGQVAERLDQAGGAPGRAGVDF